MSNLVRSLRIYSGLLFILLTAVAPFAARAGLRCHEIFAEGSQTGTIPTDRATSFGRGRYTGVEKPLSTPRFKSPARIILTRFGGHSDFHSSRSHSWTSNGNVFVSDASRDTQLFGFRDEESILAEQQDFSLAKMVETGYLTASDAEMFRRLGTNLENGQVNFFEVVHDATDEEIERFYGDFPRNRFGGSHTETWRQPRLANGIIAPLSHTIKTTAMWQIAGQFWNKDTGLRMVPLAWEKEEARKGQALDRNKYKSVWEWGRAAQDTPGEIGLLYAMNATLNYLQLRAYGGKLEDAYVMVHSFDEANTRLYQRMHPGTMYPPGWTNPKDALFLVPLKDALAKYKPSKVSAQVARIVELSEGKIEDLQALDLLIANRLNRWQELDFQTPKGKQKSPIIISDPTLNRAHLLGLRLGAFGMSRDTGQRVLDAFADIVPLLQTTNYLGKYDHGADSLLSSYTLGDMNSIEISNLDPSLAAADPRYVRSVLMASVSSYVNRFASLLREIHGKSMEDSFAIAEDFIESQGTKFAVTSSAPLIEAYLRANQPAQVIQLPATVVDGTLSEDERKRSPYLFRDARIYVFTFSQLQNLIRNNLDLHLRVSPGLKPGVWQSQYLLSQPDLF